jgi:hypothetical protein
MGLEQIAALAVFVTLMLGGLAATGRASVWIWRTVQKIVRVVDDLAGEPPSAAEPDGKPGILQQLAEMRAGIEILPTVRQHLAALEERMAAVEAQLQPNGGASLRDSMDRVERAVIPDTAVDTSKGQTT